MTNKIKLPRIQFNAKALSIIHLISKGLHRLLADYSWPRNGEEYSQKYLLEGKSYQSSVQYRNQDRQTHLFCDDWYLVNAAASNFVYFKSNTSDKDFFWHMSVPHRPAYIMTSRNCKRHGSKLWHRAWPGFFRLQRNAHFSQIKELRHND